MTIQISLLLYTSNCRSTIILTNKHRHGIHFSMEWVFIIFSVMSCHQIGDGREAHNREWGKTN